jgi:hypothetical protein
MKGEIMNESIPPQTQTGFKLTCSRPSRKEVVFLLKFIGAACLFMLTAWLLFQLGLHGVLSRDTTLSGIAFVGGAFAAFALVVAVKAYRLKNSLLPPPPH